MKNVINTYAAYSKDEELRLKSSSGAMFSQLAFFVLETGGVVYGVAMSDDCYSAIYKRVCEKEELKYLRGSKYFQAKVGNTFRNVRADLEAGKNVLFTGTGCYVNGLKTFLGKEYDNLVCVDIVCHGTPSSKLWKEYVEYQEKNLEAKLIYASFRNKDRHNWAGFEMKEIDSNYKEVYISRHIDPFFSLFVSNICLRPSCYNCIAKLDKLSDMTIADFWGIDDVAPEMNDNKGISLVLVRTKKGKKLFGSITENLHIKEVTYEQGVAKNKSEYQSYEKPENREQFFHDMNLMPFEKLYKKYLRIPLWKRIGRKVKILLKKILMGGRLDT